MRILIAEDDRETAQFIARGLSELGHEPVLAADGQEALHCALNDEVDLIVLDRMLPQRDGTSVLKCLRAASVDTPVIMLTALGGIEDRVEGLEAGADDYLVKPFAFVELAARLNALARRPRMQEDAPAFELVAGSLRMNLLAREVTRDGRPVVLQPREFRLLEELMRGEGKVLTRTMLLERVWDFHFDPQTNIVETHVSRLRSKVNKGGQPDVIETVRGSGYRVRMT